MIGKVLIVLGIALVITGLVFTFAGRIKWLGRLPGDIVIHRGDATFYFPLVTSIVASIVLTVIVNIIIRFLWR